METYNPKNKNKMNDSRRKQKGEKYDKGEKQRKTEGNTKRRQQTGK